MKFEKRDIILVAGVLLLMGGLVPFMAPIYAIIVGVLTFFGIKFYVEKRKQQVTNIVGEGICAICGEKIQDKICQNCEKP